MTWAQLPTAIWNGYDSSVSPPKVTKYDNEAIFTGSAIVVEGAGPEPPPARLELFQCLSWNSFQAARSRLCPLYYHTMTTPWPRAPDLL